MTPLRQQMIEDMQLRDSRQERRRLTRAPCGNWPNIITAVRSNSAMKSCANTFFI